MAQDALLKTMVNRALHAERKSALYFTLVHKGATAAILLVGPRKVPAAKVKEAKTKLSTATAAQGRCFGDAGTLVFETKKTAPPAWKTLVKKVVHQETGLSILPEFRQAPEGEDLGDDEPEGEEVPAATPTTTEAAAPPGSAPVSQPSFVGMQQARLLWGKTRQFVQGELQKLEKAILDKYKNKPELPQVVAGMPKLFAILDVLDERLTDKLDEALNAGTPEQRSAHHAAARKIIDEYTAYVSSSPMLADIDDNGIVGVKVRATLVQALTLLSDKLI